MGLFAKAVDKSKKNVASTSKKRATTWKAGDPEGDEVAKAVHELVEISSKMKALKAKMGMHETVLKKFALRNFEEHIAETGVCPESPMYLVNSDGEQVSWIVQDRSGQYKVKEDQKDALNQLLGEEAVEDLLYEETTFKFNREVMAMPGVSEEVEKSLLSAIKRMIKNGSLDEETAGELVDASVKESFKPGTLDRVGIICGSDTTKIRSFLEAMGSAFTRFIKA